MVMTAQTRSFIAAVFLFGFLADMSLGKRSVEGQDMAQLNSEDMAQESSSDHEALEDEAFEEDGDQADDAEEDEEGDEDDAAEEDGDEDEKDEIQSTEDDDDESSPTDDGDVDQESLLDQVMSSLLDSDEQPKPKVTVPANYQFCRSFCLLSVFPGSKTKQHGTIRYMHRKANLNELVDKRGMCHHKWSRGAQPALPKQKKGAPPVYTPRLGKTQYFTVEGDDRKVVEGCADVALPVKCQTTIFNYEKKWKLPTASLCHGTNNVKTDKMKVVTMDNNDGDVDGKDACIAEWNNFYAEVNADPKDKAAAKARKTKAAAELKLQKADIAKEKKIIVEKLKQLKVEELARKKKAKYNKMSPAKKKTYDAAEALREAKENEKQEAIALKLEAANAKKAAAERKKAEALAAKAAKAAKK